MPSEILREFLLGQLDVNDPARSWQVADCECGHDFLTTGQIQTVEFKGRVLVTGYVICACGRRRAVSHRVSTPA